jgi:hypothetical protein
MTGCVIQALLITIMKRFKRRDDCSIIRIVLQIHEGVCNPGAPHHNHAALFKVRAVVPSSGLCFKFMTGCGIQTFLITIMQHL